MAQQPQVGVLLEETLIEAKQLLSAHVPSTAYALQRSIILKNNLLLSTKSLIVVKVQYFIFFLYFM